MANQNLKMQTSSFFHPSSTPLRPPFSVTLRNPKTIFHDHHRNRGATMAFNKDDSSGKMVDENMIVLRERIRKVKAETECDDENDRFPDSWMQWEKTYSYSGGYHSDIYQVIGFLQRFLTETRPSVAVGMVAVLGFGGSATVVMVLQWLMNLVHGS